jgi:hypothetical protein
MKATTPRALGSAIAILGSASLMMAPARPAGSITEQNDTDAEREWTYDRKSLIGKLDKALDAAPAQGWTVLSMKDDWNKIFPFGSE